MSEVLAKLEKNDIGGNKVNISSFSAANTDTNTHGYAYLVLDVSKIKTLTIGSVTKAGNPNLGSYGYITARQVGGGATIKSFSVSNNPQTLDVTNYNGVELAIYFTSSGARYASISMNNITGE